MTMRGPANVKGSSSSHFVENSLRKSLWTCHKTGYIMNE